MGHRILRCHIWGYAVCLCPIKGTPGLNELRDSKAPAVSSGGLLSPSSFVLLKSFKAIKVFKTQAHYEAFSFLLQSTYIFILMFKTIFLFLIILKTRFMKKFIYRFCWSGFNRNLHFTITTLCRTTFFLR